MRTIALVLLMLTFLAAAVMPAQEAPKLKPEDISSRVDKVFAKWDNYNSPGCAVGVYRDGRTVYLHGYGMADLDHDARIEPSTVFHVASMSKQFTAASVEMLSLEGKLSLDDPARKYIPELPDFGVPITIRELIHHTSGLRDQWDLLEIAGWRYSLDLITNNDVLTLIARQKALNFPPGSRYTYCNTGYTLLGEIVKRVSGESLRDYTTHHIFEPLGMDHTHFRDNHAELVKGMAIGYVPAGGTFEISITNFDTVGATSLLTTVEDLQRWDENFYNPRVGGTPLLEEMLKVGKLNNGEVLKYASGLNVTTYRGLPVVDHAGADAGYRSDMIRFPEQHFTSAVLCNVGTANPSDLAQKVAGIYLGDKMQPEPAKPEVKPVQLTEDQLKDKAGVYLDSDADQIDKIVVKDGRLQLASEGEGAARQLTPLAEDRFRLEDSPLEFVFKPGPESQIELAVTREGGKPTLFTKLPPFTPSTVRLAEYAGTYHSEEIDALYRFRVESDKLVLRRLNNLPDTLVLEVPDLFTSELGILHFVRDPAHHVTGFVLNSGRILNFRFEKGSR
ncbi:MAG: serine hydrolase domain-containing protein [Terriglobia bacterium]